jgi:hypothetical protein
MQIEHRIATYRKYIPRRKEKSDFKNRSKYTNYEYTEYHPDLDICHV